MYKNNYLKIATVTPVIKIGDPMTNVENIQNLAREINNAQILVFPELTITGYTLGDWIFNAELLQKHEEALKYLLAKSTKQVWIIGSIFELNGSIYNVAYIIQDQRILGIVPKTYLPRSREFYEPRYFATISALSAEIKTVEIFNQVVPFGKILFKSDDNKVTFGVEVCADLWTNISPSNDLYTSGAEIIFNPSASTFYVGKNKSRLSLCLNASYKGQGAYVYTSNGPSETSSDVVFSGHQIVCQVGDVLVDSREMSMNNVYHYADIDLEKIRFKRLSAGYLHDFKSQNFPVVRFKLKPTLEYQLINLPSRMPFALSEQECEDVIDVTTIGIIRRLKYVNTTKTVIGISGGLDSSLALLFLVECYRKYNLPLEDIIAVTLPGLATGSKSKSLALRLMEKLAVHPKEISIKTEVEHHLKLIKHDDVTKDVTYENVQARYRTLVLMNMANKVGGIVIGTSDMSEIALGWSTFNGDQMAMYGVNSGLPKTTVRELVTYFAKKYPQIKAELLEIVDAPISPELTDSNQLTESIIGSYEINDFILYNVFMDGMSRSRVILLCEKVFGLTTEEATIYYDRFMRRFKRNQFKRLTIPEGIKIFELSLSPRGDFRFPGDME